MRPARHQIEIDDDVMAHLKQRAEPFEDTPNSVLRRLLLRKGEKQQDPRPHFGPGEERPPRPAFGVPRALAQTLDVIRLVRLESKTRTEATHKVAQGEGVTFQTVLDKYCRQLGLQVNQFDQFLVEADLGRLRRRMKSKFPAHDRFIDESLRPVFGEALADAQ